jgi:hypothetical protein
MGFANCRNFVQRAADESTAKCRIDGGNTKGLGTGTVLNPRRPLQGQKALAKLCDHR